MRASARSGDSTVTWAGEVTESNGPAGKVLRGTFNQGPDVLERDHRIARIGEPLGAVFNPEYAVFEILAIGLDLGLADVGTVT